MAQRIIVLVEDEVDLVEILTPILNRDGFEVAALEDGETAFQYIETQPPPNLVLIDIMLPYHDGYEIIAKIRASATWSKVPVIFLTAKSQGKDIARAFDLGADDYVVKPFQSLDLIARIKRLVK